MIKPYKNKTYAYNILIDLSSWCENASRVRLIQCPWVHSQSDAANFDRIARINDRIKRAAATLRVETY